MKECQCVLNIMPAVLKFWAKQICILLTLCGVVTSLILLIVLIGGQHLDYLPHICGFATLGCFIIFGTVQCYNLRHRNGQIC